MVIIRAQLFKSNSVISLKLLSEAFYIFSAEHTPQPRYNTVGGSQTIDRVS